MYPILISTIAGLSTLIGYLFIYLKIPQSKINKFITICLSLALTIMIFISITELIPQSFSYFITHNAFIIAILKLIAFFTLGYLLIEIINNRIGDIASNNLYRLGVLNTIALIAHNIPEGIATYISSYQDATLGLKLAISIILHNIPEGISIAIPIYYATKNRKLSLKYTLISGLAEPFGALITMIFFQYYINENILNLTLIFVSGIMVTLAINKILKETLSYNENKYISFGIILGVILCILTHFII